MAIPNRFDVVQAVNAAHPQLVKTNTRATVTEFLWRVVAELAKADPRFGFLSKSPAENGTDIPGAGRVALDALCYQGEHNSVDIVGAAGDGPGAGSIGWSEDEHRRQSNQWVRAVPFPGEPTEPPTGTTSEILRRIGEAEAKLEALERKMSDAALDAAVKWRVAGLTVTGTIDVPVVLQGFTRARAKGDVTLKVTE